VCIVDPDLRLYGAKNVFLCGSAVFPTLLALAVRLARHLG
jgi:choline dehydrogenase-like flavoprotein